MTWPAPSDPPAPPPATPRPDADGRGTARPIATWLAATGGALVLVAAVIVVAGNWQDIAPGIKFAGLLAATAAVVMAAERSRRAVPATARTLAHLGVTLVAPATIAAAAVVGGTWPTCVLAGGVVAAAAGEIQRRRWGAPLLELAVVGAAGLAVTGLAARVGLPVGVLGAITACGFLVVRRHGAAAALAVASMGPTLVVTLTEWRLGPGTLARIGATGEALAWSAPVAGVLAGGVLATVATRLCRAPLAAAAMTAPIVGVVAALAELEAGAVMDASALALAVLAVQALASGSLGDPWRRIVPPVADVAAVGAAVAAFAAPIAGHRGELAVLPIMVTVGALLVATVRTRGTALAPFVASGAVSAAVAAVAATGASALSVATTASALAVATVVADRTRRAAGPVVSTGWSVVFLLVAGGTGGLWSAALGVAAVVAMTGVVVELRLRREPPTGWWLAVPVVVGALGALAIAPAGGSALVVAVGAAGVVLVASRRPAVVGDVLTVVGAGAGYAMVGALVPTTDTAYGVGLGALAVAAAVAWWRSGTAWMAHASAIALTGAVPFGALAAGASGAEIAAAMLVGAIVSTGWSYVTIRVTPLATAGLTAGALATAVAWSADVPVLVSLGVAVGGSQAVLHGATRRMPELAYGGGAVAAAGVASLWFTAGANAAVLDALAPYGVNGADLAAGASALGALITGWLAGRHHALSSWVASAPGVTLAAGWLLAAEVQRDVRWSLPAVLTVGVVAALAGGIRRLAAPLVLGTATLGASVLVATGSRLAQLDSWAWLTIGGGALIAVAVVIERAVGDDDRDGLDWHQLRETWR